MINDFGKFRKDFNTISTFSLQVTKGDVAVPLSLLKLLQVEHLPCTKQVTFGGRRLLIYSRGYRLYDASVAITNTGHWQKDRGNESFTLTSDVKLTLVGFDKPIILKEFAEQNNTHSNDNTFTSVVLNEAGHCLGETRIFRQSLSIKCL
jgi:hypothetical protein